jgi:hypothetical protein
LAVSDYNRTKKLDVDSVSGTPTVAKATPIIIGSGDDSTTGNGDIIIDWTNVSSESDLAVYDQNGNLLPYEIEEFDSTAETATLWVYDSWVRDGSTQAQVVYGDGPASSEEGTASDVWGNTGQNAEAVFHFNESSAPFLDSTSNDNDSTSSNGVTTVQKGLGGAINLDGTDDFVEGPTSSGLSSLIISDTGTIVGYIENSEVSQSSTYVFDYADNGYSIIYGYTTDTYEAFTGKSTTNVDIKTISDTDTHQLGFSIDSQSVTTYFDGISQNTGSLDLGDGDIDNGFTFGDSGIDSGNFDGVFEEFRIYSDNKSGSWWQADYDASPEGGQIFFSQRAGESTLPSAQGIAATATGTTTTATVITTPLAQAVSATGSATTTTASGIIVSDVTGTVTLDGTAVQGAEVYGYNETDEEFIANVTTDSNGGYTLTQAGFAGETILVAVDYDDGSRRYGDAKSTVI